MERGSDGPSGAAASALVSREPTSMYLTIGVMGTVNGLAAGAIGYYLDASFLDLHAAIWLFLVVWAATTAYLSYRRVPSGVLAAGLYLLGLLVLLQPVVVYGPVLAAASNASPAASSKLIVEGARGIVRWGVTAGLLAVAFTFVGRFLRRRAERVVRRRRTRGFRRDAER